ncbi:MAG: tail fiber domain-containing protein [Bacteroidales bacterium]|nr:tail fiber domain-containing protein [Bacteroidales bacterium]
MKSKLLPGKAFCCSGSDFLLPKILIVLALLALRPAPSALSQTPQGFNYQAIARDASGNPIAGAIIKVKLSILSDTTGFYGGTGGIYIWEEEHLNVKTNDFGMFSVVLGSTTATMVQGSAGSFSEIDWSPANLFVGTKIANPTDYKVMGSAKLWSVPYAMRANESGQWTTSGTNIYRSTGNVGIGTANPVFKLQVQGGESLFGYNSGNGALRFTTAYGNSFMFKPLDHALQIQTDHIGLPTILYLDKSGLVGVGTDVPAARLHVAGNTLVEGSLHVNAYTGFGDGIIVGNDSKISDINIANTLGIIGLQDPNQGHIRLGATGPIISGYNGNVGIGTTIPDSKLTVKGTISAGYLLVDPQDGVNEGGEFLLAGAGSNPGLAIDNWGGHVRMHTFANGKYLHLVNGLLNADGTDGTNYFAGNVGIGTTTSSSKMVIQPPADWDDNTPLFEVRNKKGAPVLAVYNYGVRVLVDHTDSKAVKGGFAIGGFDETKAGETVNLMMISPDSIRFNINNSSSKAVKGGFAIGGFDESKGTDSREFMSLTPNDAGYGVYNTFVGYQAGKNTKGEHNTFLGMNAGMGLAGNAAAANIFIGEGAGYRNNGSSTPTLIFLPGGGATTAYITSGGNNIAIGYYSGTNISGAAMSGDGNSNVLVGNYSGHSLSTGRENVIVGHAAGKDMVSGRGNVFIGFAAGQTETGSNKLYIDNSNTASPLIQGDFLNNTLVLNGEVYVAATQSYLNIMANSGANNRRSRIAMWGTFGTGTPDYISRNFATIETGSTGGWGDGFIRFLGRYYSGTEEVQFEMMRLNTYNGNLGLGNTNPGYKLTVNGTAWCSAGAWTGSDERWKENITPLDGALKAVSQLNPVSYFLRKDAFPEMNFESGRQIGLIAQEVEIILPELVRTDNNGYKSVSYEKLSVVLLDAVKELTTRVEEQQNHITRLEKNVAELQSLKAEIEALKAMIAGSR